MELNEYQREAQRYINHELSPEFVEDHALHGY